MLESGSKNSEKTSFELSVLVAVILFIALIAFVGGYFLGVRHGARTCVFTHQEEIAEELTEESGVPVINEEMVQVPAVQVPAVQVPAVQVPGADTQSRAVTPAVPVAENTHTPASITEQEQRFWAIAATVGSYARATQLMEQAATVNIVVRIKKLVRMLPKNKKRVLYQLVTPRYASSDELAHALQMLKTLPVWTKYIQTPLYHKKDAHA